MKLSLADIAFEGFRVVRDRPQALIAWVVLQFAALLALQPGVLMARNAYETMSKLGFLPTPTSPQPVATPTPAQAELALSLMGDLFSGVGLALISTLVVSALFEPSVYRVAMTPRDRGVLGLKLGLQELRQFGLLAALFGLFFGIYLCGDLASLLLTSVFSVAGQGAAVMGYSLSVTGLFCALIYFSVRLALAGPLTFDQGKIDVFGSWTLTRGRFYGLLGGLALATLMALLVALLASTIVVALLSFVTDPAKLKGPFDVKAPSLDDLYAWPELVRDFGAAVAGALAGVILVGARAQAYIQIRSGGVTA